MKTKISSRKSDEFPKRSKEGHAEFTICRLRSSSRRSNPITGKLEATAKIFAEFALAQCHGTRHFVDRIGGEFKTLPKFVRQQFGVFEEEFCRGSALINRHVKKLLRRVR